MGCIGFMGGWLAGGGAASIGRLQLGIATHRHQCLPCLPWTLRLTPRAAPLPAAVVLQAPGSELVVGVMANVIASIMSVAGTLRHLTIETAGQVRRCFHDFGGQGGHERPVAGVAAPRVCGGWQNGRPGGHVARHTAIASSLFAHYSASPTHPPATPRSWWCPSGQPPCASCAPPASLRQTCTSSRAWASCRASQTWSLGATIQSLRLKAPPACPPASPTCHWSTAVSRQCPAASPA